jgi:hypothetical protein
MAQVVEQLLSKCESLNSNPSSIKQIKKKKKNFEICLGKQINCTFTQYF